VKYVLDTNTVSFLMRGDPEVLGELTSRSRTDVLLPQPVAAEIEYGLAKLPNSAKKRRLRQRWDGILVQLMRAEWGDDVSRAFGTIKADLERRGVRVEDFDVAIAAHALALEATLVTDNVEHMGRIRGMKLESWRTTSF
jgi:tRNA(fMet)-specific endonuclease VapC